MGEFIAGIGNGGAGFERKFPEGSRECEKVPAGSITSLEGYGRLKERVLTPDRLIITV